MDGRMETEASFRNLQNNFSIAGQYKINLVFFLKLSTKKVNKVYFQHKLTILILNWLSMWENEELLQTGDVSDKISSC